MGAVRALTYLLVYGFFSLALGACWAASAPWALSVPAAAAARIAGYAAYIALSSWVGGWVVGCPLVFPLTGPVTPPHPPHIPPPPPRPPSQVTNENLAALLTANVSALLDQLSAALGVGAGAPSPLAVTITIASLLFVNSLFYAALMHFFYALLLRPLGHELRGAPPLVARLAAAVPLQQQQFGGAAQ